MIKKVLVGLGVFAFAIAGFQALNMTAEADHANFRLDGTAQHAQDPENSANQVIRINTTTPAGQCVQPAYANCPVGRVSRALGVKVAQLDSMLSFKHYFVTPKNCNAGIPRMTLLIDADGDGDFQQFPASPDFAAHGHTFPLSGCPPAPEWVFQNLTDAAPRWEVTPGTAGLPIGLPTNVYQPWDTFEAAITVGFPNHRVCSGFLIDSNEASAAQAGVAYYDEISIGNATWYHNDDTEGRGTATNCRMAGQGGGHNGGFHEEDDDGRPGNGGNGNNEEDDDGHGNGNGEEDDD